MIDPFISSILWLTLVAVDVIISIRLALMYRKDYDKRKLMFIIGLSLTSFTYIVAIYGINSSALARRVFEWCPTPIMFAFIFSIFNDRFNFSLTKYYKVFLAIVATTISLFFIPFPFPSALVLLPGVVFAVFLAFHQYSKHFDLSSVTLILSMPSYSICYVALYQNITELAIFSAFVAKIFLLLAFEVAKNQTGIVFSPLRLQKKLDKAKENFSILFNLLPDPAVIVDKTGNFLEVTDGITKATGFTKEDIFGKNFLKIPILTAKSKAIVVKNLTKRMMGLHVAPYEIEVLRKDGKKLSFELNASKIEYEGKTADLVLFRDLTERYQLIKSVAEKEERFRDIANNTGDWVWEIDQQGRYVYTNSGVEKILGYKAEQIIGKGFSDFLLHDENDVNDFFESVPKQKGSYEFTKQCLHKSGKKNVLETRAVPIMNEDGQVVGYRGIDRDITEKREMQEKLLKSERLATVGEVAAMVAHDLRNPLQSIATAIYCLEKTNPDEGNEKITKLMTSVKDAVNYSDKIVKELLEYSAKIKLEITESDPNEIISQALSTIEVPSNVNLFNETKTKPTIYVDVNRIRRVCINIISNALDAMPKGGTLTVSSKQLNGNLELTFSDTGAGMTQKNIDKIMTPFFTTKAKGMGLGLAISKRIVEAHTGKIIVNSKIGQGTTFTIILPINKLQKQLFNQKKPHNMKNVRAS